ncbi:zinc finger BED domain-containing protein 4-like [Onthophagus taurus]|uniref:zinc finger BED domain-containing protein 4-like n=1 Tax=Onthophagus taurus TaxID=166361 RepID=UPI0039BDAF73
MKPKTSFIWEYFSEINSSVARCNICEKEYSRKGRTTSSLKNHLKSKHAKIFEELEKRIAENAEQGQPTCSTSTDTGSITKQLSLQEYLTQNVCWDLPHPNSKDTDRLIGEMIALEDLPFNFVEGVGFRRLINIILPGYKLRGRQFFTSLVCDDLYNSVANKIKALLNDLKKISFTTDVWSDTSSGTSLISVTAHGVNEGFERVRIILKCEVMEGRHPDQAISTKTESILEEWGIKHDTVHCVVRGRGSNMIKAMQISGLNDFNCVIHQIQCCIKNVILSEEWIQEVIEKVKKVSTHFNHSLVAQDELQTIQEIRMKQSPLSTIQDCPTRWNSTFYMLERFVKIKDSLLLYLTTKQFVSFSPDDLSTIELLLKLLTPFEELTKELSNSKNSISMVIPLMHVILATLKAEKDNPNTPEKIKALYVKVIREINEFGDLNQNLLCSVSTYLDPRYKTKFFNSFEIKQVEATIVNLCQNQTIHENKDCSPTHKKRKIDTNSSSCSKLLQSVQSILSSSESEAEDDQLTTPKIVLQNYIKERRLSLGEDPLTWWRQNGYKYTVLLPIVRQYLSTPPSSFTNEQLFSGASLTYRDKRKNLRGEKASKLLFLKYNLPVINYEY